MKKMLGMLVAFTLVLGFAGQGMATFADLEVIRVIYDQTTSLEYASDLGKIGVGNLATVDGTTGTAFTGSNVNLGHAFSPTSVLGGTAATDTLKVAYMAVDSTNGFMWLSGTSATRAYTGLDSNYTAMANMYVYYGAASSDASKSTTDSRSYSIGMDGASYNIAGSFDHFFANGTGSEAAFTYGQTPSLNLYYYGNPYASPNIPGVNMGTLQMQADGSTLLNPNAVPIPAAVWLLGSGLLGLIGVRRRNA